MAPVPLIYSLREARGDAAPGPTDALALAVPGPLFGGWKEDMKHYAPMKVECKVCGHAQTLLVPKDAQAPPNPMSAFLLMGKVDETDCPKCGQRALREKRRLEAV